MYVFLAGFVLPAKWQSRSVRSRSDGCGLRRKHIFLRAWGAHRFTFGRRNRHANTFPVHRRAFRTCDDDDNISYFSTCPGGKSFSQSPIPRTVPYNIAAVLTHRFPERDTAATVVILVITPIGAAAVGADARDTTDYVLFPVRVAILTLNRRGWSGVKGV